MNCNRVAMLVISFCTVKLLLLSSFLLAAAKAEKAYFVRVVRTSTYDGSEGYLTLRRCRSTETGNMDSLRTSKALLFPFFTVSTELKGFRKYFVGDVPCESLRK